MAVEIRDLAYAGSILAVWDRVRVIQQKIYVPISPEKNTYISITYRKKIGTFATLPSEIEYTVGVGPFCFVVLPTIQKGVIDKKILKNLC